MKTIVLTEREIEVIEKHLRGEIGQFSATDEEIEILTRLIDDAEALQDEMDAVDEVMAEPNCDLMSWYLKKYREQEAAAE